MIELRAGALAARINPIGAALEELIFDGATVIGAPGAYSGSVLFPWPNRIFDGTYRFEGQEYFLEINDPQRIAALHGLVGNSKFDVVEINDTNCVLAYVLNPSDGYPFRVSLLVTFTLNQNALKVVSQAKNLGNQNAPVAIGFHPYFKCTDNTQFSTNQVLYYAVDDRLMPMASLPLGNLNIKSGESAEFNGLNLDTTFFGSSKPNWKLTTKNWIAEVNQNGLGYTNIFTNRFSDPSVLWVAIEPQSAPTNAFQSGESVVSLFPGEAIDFEFEVAVAAAT